MADRLVTPPLYSTFTLLVRLSRRLSQAEAPEMFIRANSSSSLSDRRYLLSRRMFRSR